jgi:plasmid stabilization system protein ParE
MSKRPLRVVYGPEAKLDLIERATYLADEAGLNVSDRFVDAVAHTLDLLSKMPDLGRVFGSRKSRRRELRYISVSGAFDHTIIFYTHTASELRVERLLHGSQNLPRFFP